MSSTTNRSVATLGCALIASLWLGPSPVIAQRAVQPRVSVVTFEGSGAPREARDAMADELAARLVDTGHFRVLHREWLPHGGDEVPALDVLRAAAASVDVDYLVLGSIRQSNSVPSPHSSVMASRGLGPAVGPSILLRRPAAPAPVQRQTTVVMSIRVIDVASSDVVRTAAAQRTYTSNTMPAPYLVPISRPPTLAAAIATVAARPKPPSARLTKDWRRLVLDVAGQLDVRGVPPAVRR